MQIIYHELRLEMRGNITASAAIAAIALFASLGWTQAPDPQQASAAVLKQYCATCHSAAIRTAGVTIDPAKLGEVSADAELWERVVRQLRAQSMPPSTAPRPDAATYTRVASFLETQLDR